MSELFESTQLRQKVAMRSENPAQQKRPVRQICFEGNYGEAKQEASLKNRLLLVNIQDNNCDSYDRVTPAYPPPAPPPPPAARPEACRAEACCPATSF